ncbi:glycine cleavage system H protein, mitochondrial isoform X2 [Tribolium castaneum]|uniref:Glycine cleavage system H protein n=2 Tax=Tribolium castaneum TaxID=7070 RepID=D7EI00_TRICA|nr:PREDICTED: glycine cleavage system H protein, mitochondrial isoform X2 [Tribolium castaneum]XP_969000.1 PREDICTED: glycine cleavage system H protein, mitochondrial isoform X2 [Tribolium castaneum]EFA12932.2 Glycine cleavage system H protein, mitochondrial-like Protein [Tribolium castaneum]|eukprot:XP_008199780.1 PREDICTED: glycine cleavage system H protein, mitochondrial isoform X2 [Tribolium castaneum]
MVIHRFVRCVNNSTARQLIFNQCRKHAINRSIFTTPSFWAERLYTDKHEWVEVDGKTGKVGISQYAQEALGDVVYAQLPDVDTVLKQKDECGALESVKAASEVYSPISGKVVEKNTSVEETPSLINSSCYDKGWLFKIELSDTGELKSLMTETQYNEYLKTQEH